VKAAWESGKSDRTAAAVAAAQHGPVGMNRIRIYMLPAFLFFSALSLSEKDGIIKILILFV
jgi:hypothetical protein